MPLKWKILSFYFRATWSEKRRVYDPWDYIQLEKKKPEIKDTVSCWGDCTALSGSQAPRFLALLPQGPLKFQDAAGAPIPVRAGGRGHAHSLLKRKLCPTGHFFHGPAARSQSDVKSRIHPGLPEFSQSYYRKSLGPESPSNPGKQEQLVTQSHDHILMQERTELLRC